MTQAIKVGDTISVHYTGKFEDDQVFDSSEGREPLKFTVGRQQLISGFDSAVVGMVTGEKKTVTIAPEDGYGQRSDERMFDMPRENIPADMELERGMMVQLSGQSGEAIPAMVLEIGETSVTLDMNHPLAGRTLVFDIEIVATGLTPDAQCGDGKGSCGSCCGGCGE
jgi:peptidylprolyl isomerase